jgi:hypothetical protein
MKISARPRLANPGKIFNFIEPTAAGQQLFWGLAQEQ